MRAFEGVQAFSTFLESCPKRTSVCECTDRLRRQAWKSPWYPASERGVNRVGRQVSLLFFATRGENLFPHSGGPARGIPTRSATARSSLRISPIRSSPIRVSHVTFPSI